MEDLVPRLLAVASQARSKGQLRTAREIEALVQKLGAKYFFLANPGGDDVIPDNEYVEFPDEQAVVIYVNETLLGEQPGTRPGELETVREQIGFDEARKMLMEVGEFGELKVPLTPPNTMLGAREVEADLQAIIDKLQGTMSNLPTSLKEQWEALVRIVKTGRMETVGGIEIDVGKAALVLRLLATMNPAAATAAMAMGVLNVLHQAYSFFGKGEETTASYEEAAFYKEVLPPHPEDQEEWEQELAPEG